MTLPTGARFAQLDTQHPREPPGSPTINLYGVSQRRCAVKARFGDKNSANPISQAPFDLSHLEFMDCAGALALIEAVAEASRQGLPLEIEADQLASRVARV
jgi:hypothetical protein